ncbi:MAG: DUF2892 domain-containing protein [Sphingobacteriales bacterium]|nr:MAG: DUF2892 domain-containing protein [Sphingobacteriales bacterium]
MDQNTFSLRNKTVNVDTPERAISVAAGSLLLLRGLSKFSLLQMAAGGFMLYRGLTGHCAAYKAMGVPSLSEEQNNIKIDTTLTINKPKNEVYAFWRKLENLPLFMKHLESVTQLSEGKSHWVAKIPSDLTKIEWDAQIINEVENTLISWSSLPGATVENAGKVEFYDADNGQTMLHIVISYSAPLGAPGLMVRCS